MCVCVHTCVPTHRCRMSSISLFNYKKKKWKTRWPVPIFPLLKLTFESLLHTLNSQLSGEASSAEKLLMGNLCPHPWFHTKIRHAYVTLTPFPSWDSPPNFTQISHKFWLSRKTTGSNYFPHKTREYLFVLRLSHQGWFWECLHIHVKRESFIYHSTTCTINSESMEFMKKSQIIYYEKLPMLICQEYSKF